MKRRHGTPQTYRGGCRCEVCRDGWRIYAISLRSSLMEPDPEASIAKRVEFLYAPQDAERMAYLDHVVKVLAKCRYCGSTLTDESLAAHPQLCAYHARKKPRAA